MEDAGIPNRTQLLRIHLPAVGGLYVSAVTPHLGSGAAAALPHALSCRSPLRWSFILPFRQQLEPFVRGMELSRYSQDGERRDSEVAALLESCHRHPERPLLRAVGVWGHPQPLKHPENLSWEPGGIQRIRLCPGRPRAPGCSDFWQPPAVPSPLG